MHFMIDFENVNNRGLQGCEYLRSDDVVIIFYSPCCAKMESRKFQLLKNSGCKLELCKLEKTGKNALDFYIASKIGEVYGAGFNGVIGIVSGDSGFKAVLEYWRKSENGRKNIFLKENVEQCIAASSENSTRRTNIKYYLRDIDLEVEYGKYEEQIKIRNLLEEHFVNTEYEDDIDEIMDIIEGETTPRILYLEMLKTFGKKNGLIIYRNVKQLQGLWNRKAG